MDEELRQALQEMLSKTEGGTDLYDKVLNSVNTLKSKANTEKTLGVKTKKTLDKLQDSFDNVSASLQNVGFDSEEDVSLDDFLEGFQKPGKKINSAGDVVDYVLEDQPAFKKLQKQLTTTLVDLEGEKKKVYKAETDKKNNTIQRTLTGAFKNEQGNLTHYGVESRVENLVLTNKLGVNEDNDVYWRDSVDEDKEVPFDDGFKTYLDTPEVKRDLRSTQHEGGGSSSGGAGTGGKVTDAERIQQINKNTAFSFVK